MQTSYPVAILAAGLGKRMGAACPKVLTPVGGEPLLGHVLSAIPSTTPHVFIVVSTTNRDAIKNFVTRRRYSFTIDYVLQDPLLGTGHALMCLKKALANQKFSRLLVLLGDVPFISRTTIERMGQSTDDILSVAFSTNHPTGYGRLIVRHGKLCAIREERDLSSTEATSAHVHSGLFSLNTGTIFPLLEHLDNNTAKGEYYLTQLVELAYGANLKTGFIAVPEEEAMGINTPTQYASALETFQKRRREAFLEAGVGLLAPHTFFCSFDTKIAKGSFIHPYVVCGTGVIIGKEASILPFSNLEQVDVGEGATVGPFARLRGGTHVDAGADVGNFVEIKKSHIGPRSKVKHLAYVGDAELGRGVNVGAGTVFANYDGEKKHPTSVEDGTFIGSNSTLVAPLTLHRDAFVAAGTVMTRDLESRALGMARPEEIHFPDWQDQKKKEKDT